MMNLILINNLIFKQFHSEQNNIICRGMIKILNCEQNNKKKVEDKYYL